MRTEVQAFVATEDICVGESKALANSHLGAGGGTQYYVTIADRIKLAPGPTVPLH
jgi:hypothetical protein